MFSFFFWKILRSRFIAYHWLYWINIDKVSVFNIISYVCVASVEKKSQYIFSTFTIPRKVRLCIIIFFALFLFLTFCFVFSLIVCVFFCLVSVLIFIQDLDWEPNCLWYWLSGLSWHFWLLSTWCLHCITGRVIVWLPRNWIFILKCSAKASSASCTWPFNTLPPLIGLPGRMFAIHVPLVTQLGTTSVAWYNLHFRLIIVKVNCFLLYKKWKKPYIFALNWLGHGIYQVWFHHMLMFNNFFHNCILNY